MFPLMCSVFVFSDVVINCELGHVRLDDCVDLQADFCII